MLKVTLLISWFFLIFETNFSNITYISFYKNTNIFIFTILNNYIYVIHLYIYMIKNILRYACFLSLKYGRKLKIFFFII